MMQQNNPSMFNFISERVNEQIREGNKPMKGAEGFLGIKGDKQ